MSETKLVMCVLEGTCPDCKHELDLVSATGSGSFLKEYGESFGTIVFNSPRGYYNDRGMLHFECLSCTHKFEVYQTRGRDWILV